VGFDPLPSGELPPPSKGEQLEAGLRWDAPSQPISLQLSAFQIRQTNIVNGDLNNPGFSTLTGSQRHRGFEAEANARIADAIDLYAAWTHLDARITNSNLGDQGLRPIDVPVNSASFYATLDGNVFDLGGSSLSLGLRHVGSRRANDLGDTLPAFTLLDAAVRARFGRVDLAFHAKNLTNTRFFTAGGLRSVQIGEPRIFQASLSTRF
jgi:iron complex outermembrane receptor protein